MRRLSLLALCLLSACPKNRCKERVATLREIAVALDTLRLQQEPWVYVGVSELAQGSAVKIRAFEGPRPPTFVVRAQPEVPIAPSAAVDAISALQAKGTVRLCGIRSTPDWKFSSAADPAQTAAARKDVEGIGPEDQATIFAGKLAEAGIGKVGECITRTGTVAPAEKAAVVTRCIAEELEDCGCPGAGAERAFAFATLMLDTWDYTGDCVEAAAAGDAGQLPVPPGATFGALQAAFKAR